MNRKTYILLVLLKWGELAYNLTIFICMIYSCCQFGGGFFSEPVVMIIPIMSIIATVIAFYHTVYNTLLTNMRADCRRNNFFGFVCYKIPNWLVCECAGVGHVCTERLFKADKFRTGFFVKWVLSYCYFGALIVLIYIRKQHAPELYAESDQDKMQFEILALLYVLQHAVFFVSRAVFFLIWTFMTMCCDCGQSQDFPENETFSWSKISPDYIENNLQAQREPSIRQQIQFRRENSVVRQTMMKEMQNKLTNTQVMQQGLQKQMLLTFAIDNDLGYCPICTFKLDTKDTALKIVQLTCNYTHAMHESCYAEYKKHRVDNNKALECPICRVLLQPELVQVVNDFNPRRSTLNAKIDREQLARDMQKAEAELANIPELPLNQNCVAPQVPNEIAAEIVLN